jgi:hypothetical protein
MGSLMELYIIAGPNGVGKTTFARNPSQICQLQELRQRRLDRPRNVSLKLGQSPPADWC